MTRCAHCSAEFSHTSGRGGYQPRRRFCSSKCKDDAKNAARREPHTYVCGGCGQTPVLLHEPRGQLCRPCAAAQGSRAAASAALSVPIIQRIESQIKISEEGCWLWTGVLQKNGYGSISYQGHPERAHRVSYQAYVGPIPEGLQIDHLCRRRSCVNPKHLEPVTAAENQRRAADARKANA